MYLPKMIKKYLKVSKDKHILLGIADFGPFKLHYIYIK